MSFQSCFDDTITLGTNNNSGEQNKIYVNPTNGDDSREGRSVDLPIKTLDRAGQVCKNGDTIFIMGGIHYNVNQDFKRMDDQSGWVCIMPYNNESVILDGNNNPSPAYDAIVTIQSSRNVSIKNLTIRNFNNQNEGKGLRIVSDELDINGRYSDNVIVDNCLVHNTRSNGILVQGKNVKITNCEIFDACLRNQYEAGCATYWDAAIQTYLYPVSLTSCNNIEFTNNRIHDSWGEGMVFVAADGFKAEGNKIYNCYSAYIYADNSYNGEISHNWLFADDPLYNRTCRFPSGYIAPGNGIFWAAEGGSYYNPNRMPENISIHNNFIYGTSAAFGWFDSPTNTSPYNSYRNINIYYNTVYATNCYESFYIDPNPSPGRTTPSNCSFKNNIISIGNYSGNNQNYFVVGSDLYNSNIWNISNNCFIQAPMPNFVNNTNIQANPLFLNPNVTQPQNFQISANSPCIGRGIVIPGVTVDYFYNIRHNSPTIGFFEF